MKGGGSVPDTTENRAEPWLNVSSLVIEVTRRCNLKCEHCLRGDAEDMDMDPELMAAFLKNVRHVGEVTFSGGEPSINLQAIRSFYRICDEYGIPVDGFFVATNGVANQAGPCCPPGGALPAAAGAVRPPGQPRSVRRGALPRHVP